MATSQIAVYVADVKEFADLADAAALVVQVTPRSPSIDRLQEALVALYLKLGVLKPPGEEAKPA